MLFSSMTFISIFLPTLFIVYYVCRQELRNIILLIFSLIFYAWGEPKFVLIMLSTIFITYVGGIVISKVNKWKKFALICSIVSILSFLIYFKYFNFLFSTLNSVFHTHFDIIYLILPLGISFYIFQALSYIIDVYRGDCHVQKNLYKLALYITFFPQLIAGPIIKYKDICNQIEYREEHIEDIVEGLKKFVVGLAKKVLLANNLGFIANKVFLQTPDILPFYIAWLGIICFALQIAFDFMGYSDMAIGLARIFGFKIPENFDYPIISKSLTEFWRRWHISLGTWFRLYVYYPLGGNRKGFKRQCLNIIIVFLLVGLWHGASWSFVLWGLYIGIFTIIERITGLAKDSDNLFVNFFKHIYFLINIWLTLVLFKCDNLYYAFNYLKDMFGLLKPRYVMYPITYYITGWWEIIILVITILCCTPLFKDKKFPYIYFICLFILCITELAADTYNPFIYFRF